THCAWIRWSRQLQGTQGGHLKLMEQSSEQVSLIRNVFGPGWYLTREDDEFLQEGVDVSNATFSGKLADIPRSEVKSPHGNGSRHRNAMDGPRWYPHRTSGRNNPESLLRLYGHYPLGSEDQLVPSRGNVPVFGACQRIHRTASSSEPQHDLWDQTKHPDVFSTSIVTIAGD